MKILLAAILLSMLGPPQRAVQNNVLTSSHTPRIRLRVAEEFEYVGSFPFSITADSSEYPQQLVGKVVAKGERYVFAASSPEKKVRKLFIVQLEGFLPENDQIYRYRFDRAEQIGENKYRNNAWFFDAAEADAEAPPREAGLTRRFLREKGYVEENEYMSSRFVGLADTTRKNEIILFYFEAMSLSGHRLSEFGDNGLDSARIEGIKVELVKRSRKSFEIIEG